MPQNLKEGRKGYAAKGKRRQT